MEAAIAPVVVRLNLLHPLDDQSLSRLADALSHDRSVVPARQDLRLEGMPSEDVMVVLEGWLCRYKTLPGGTPQVVGLCLPGDICDPNVFGAHPLDFSVRTLTRTKLAIVKADALVDLLTENHSLSVAVFRAAVARLSMEREWTVTLGRRSALERVAHFLCEVFVRLQEIGWVLSDTCRFPLTQNDIGLATGITAIHANRVTQELRRLGLIELQNRELTVLDLDGLQTLAMFDPSYFRNDQGPSRQPVAMAAALQA